MAWYPALLNQENSTVHAVLDTVSSKLKLINGDNASEWQWSAVQWLNDTDQIETSEDADQDIVYSVYLEYTFL